MNDPASPAHLLAQLIDTDLHRCMFGLEMLGSSFAIAHLSAAIDALRSEFPLPAASPPLTLTHGLDFSIYDEMIERLVTEWPSINRSGELRLPIG